MNTNLELTRANKLTVKLDTHGILQADFFRTHKHIRTILATETEYQPSPNANKSTIREGFRAYVAENSAIWGVCYDPTDRRTEENTRKATYSTDQEVFDDAEAMIMPDLLVFRAKMPHSDKLAEGFDLSWDAITPMLETAKGTPLTKLGIEDGKYASNGRWAWANIEAMVTMRTPTGVEIYQPIMLELVSGQLKKPTLTQTGWNTNAVASMLEAGILTEEEAHPKKAKAEKSAKAESKPKADGDPTYTVTYAVKAGHQNGEEHEESMKVTAKTAKDACKLARELYKKATGNTAFRPKATKVEG